MARPAPATAASFRRTAATWTSSVLVEPYQWASQTSAMSASRLTALPASAASRASSSNSLVAQLHLEVVDRDPARGGVDHQPADHDLLLARRHDRLPPQVRADAGEQLAEPERLGEVVVGAGLQADHDVHLVGARGQHDQHHAGGGAQPPADLHAVQVGQAEVEQGHVERPPGRGVEPLAPGPLPRHRVPVRPQAAGQRGADRLVVLDDQQVRHGRTLGRGPVRDLWVLCAVCSRQDVCRPLTCGEPAVPVPRPRWTHADRGGDRADVAGADHQWQRRARGTTAPPASSRRGWSAPGARSRCGTSSTRYRGPVARLLREGYAADGRRMPPRLRVPVPGPGTARSPLGAEQLVCAYAARALGPLGRGVRPRRGGHHLPAGRQAIGTLRADGRLQMPAYTYLTDPAVHVSWLHPAVDRHLTVTAATARTARPPTGWRWSGRPARPGAFLRAAARGELAARCAPELSSGGDRPLALLVARLARSRDCGHGEDVVAAGFTASSCAAATRPLAGASTGPASSPSGWRDDVHRLLQAADVLVQNAGGLSFTESLVAGSPGGDLPADPRARPGQRGVLEESGLAPWARDRRGPGPAPARAGGARAHRAPVPRPRRPGPRPPAGRDLAGVAA